MIRYPVPAGWVHSFESQPHWLAVYGVNYRVDMVTYPCTGVHHEDVACRDAAGPGFTVGRCPTDQARIGHRDTVRTCGCPALVGTGERWHR